jgi:hypothetical protein
MGEFFMKLADLSNIQFISGYPRDLAKELGPDGIMAILRIICEAYKELRASGRATSIMSEPEITEELYVELLDVWKEADIPLKHIHEKSHGKRKKGRGKTPTIDFCFRHKWDPTSYFGAECKLLEENNSELYKLYVDEGVNRYLSGKYGEKCSAGSMIGYIIIGSTAEIINNVKIRVDKLPNIFSNMTKSDFINGFTDHYKSVHERGVGNTPFHIHHLFFSFT